MTNAVFQATFHKAIPVVSRGTIQVVLEVSSEFQKIALDVLGGMVPPQGQTVWCAVARLTDENLHSSVREGEGRQTGSHCQPSPSRSFEELSATQQAGILCKELSFREYLKDSLGTHSLTVNDTIDLVRRRLGVVSRRDIADDPEAAARWSVMLSAYRAWQKRPVAA